MQLLWAILIVPGLVFAYVAILRPLLGRIPAFQKFYAAANGFWQKVWAICGNSLVIAGHYIFGGLSAGLVLLDSIGSLIGDPDLKEQVQNLFQSNPKVLGYVMMAISLITILFRIRSIIK